MNITLIGMPGSGKSVLGVLLAKKRKMNFLDGDLLIQNQEGRLLKEIIEMEGLEGFQKIENQVNAGINAENTVISPGGSICYCEEAMKHLKEISTIVYLKISYESLEKRLGDLRERGVCVKEGMTLRDLYEERVPLYERYADVTVDENGRDIGGMLAEICKNLPK